MNVKYIVLSIVVIGVVLVGGFYLFSDKASSSSGATLQTNVQVNGSAQNGQTQSDTTGSTTSVTTTSSTSTTAFIATHSKTTNHMITLETNYGTITLETYDSDAPNTVANFVTLANKGFYNNLTFHRIIPGFMIQGGDPSGNGTGGPGYSFADELNPATPSFKTGYKKGVIAMANSGPNTNGSQFFIMLADYQLPNNYTIFGHVTSGQDIVDKIGGVKTGANDRPVSPVVMKKVTVK